MPDVIISKYGGSSITSREDIARIVRITADDQRRKLIVVSAPGKRFSDDVKVTDMLITLARTRDCDLADKVLSRYQELCPGEDIKHLHDLLDQRLRQDLGNEAYTDSLKAFGEEASANLLARALNATYVDPRDILLVSGSFGDSRILPESGELIRQKIRGNGIFVVPGFYGYTKEGRIATFSRGGSDVTGAYLAASLDAILYENFTDREGIFATDPDLIKNPVKIKELTFEEMRDLSYSGFTIYHQAAMEPVARKRIPVHVRSTYGYPTEGTYIVDDRISDPEKPIVGIAYMNGFCSFDIERFGLNEEMGVARRILQVFEDENLSIEFMPSAIDDISVVLKEGQLGNRNVNSIGKLKNKLHAVVGENASINFQEHLGCLVVAGKGLKGRRGISAGIQLTLAEAGINLKFISQGPRERCIVYGIEDSDKVRAVNAVYGKYIL